MTKRVTQSQQIGRRMRELMESGMTDKQEIYNKIEKETGLKRPTIRRAAGELLKELHNQVRILSVRVEGGRK